VTTVPLTVVVPAHGNEDQLRLALDALFAAEPRAAEVLVVDDASPRPVAPQISGYDCRTMRRAALGGPGAARNDGVAAARHDVVLFVDSDVVVQPDTLGKVAAVFQRSDAPDAVFGSYDDDPGADTFLAQYRNLLHHFIHQGAERAAQTFWAGCGAIRKSSFLSAGGFDVARFNRPSVEDIDLGYRMIDRGMRIELDKAIQVRHLKKWTLGEMIRVDVFKRAAPWTRLMLERGSVPPDLNLRSHHRISGVLVLLLLGLALAWIVFPSRGYPVLPLALGACIVALLVLNRDFYGFLLRRRGLWFTLRAIPLHWLYYLYSAITFAVVNVWFRLRRTIERQRPRS
jgi:GT2 family glycosyltransferase